jgi:hypothetical protein
MKRTRNRADLARRLRQMADAIEHDEHLIPAIGLGPERIGGGLTVPAVVHDLLCGWQVRVRLDTHPPVALCPGCNLTIRQPATHQENQP